ncbi:hypothetical protein MBLNU457_3436t1 [Dothideomycetes sp. NU457]
MARRSTRLSARKSSTPQPRRVSTLEHDGALRTPRTAPRMASLTESDEMPGAFPKDSPPADSYMTEEAQSTPTKVAEHIAQAVIGSYHTPKHTTPVKPDAEEMHPQKFQVSTAKPDEEARWLGFSNMAPHTEPAKGAAKLVPAPGTPSKTPKANSTSQPSDFQFTFRAGSLELSEEARKFMAEKREEAAKIKEQMMQEEESQRTADTTLGRKLATAKGKVGRFSDVHMAQFKKMDSIADHASVTRPAHSSATSGTLSSLKRSSSKAGLVQGSRAGTKPVDEASANKNKFSSLPRSNSTKSLSRPVDGDPAVSVKRFKRVVEDDAGTSRPASSGSESNSTMSTPKGMRLHSSNPHLKAATPTAASLARQASIKSNKTSMIPLSRSPSKSTLTAVAPEQQKPATPLLARSPSKGLLAPSRSEAVEAEVPASPLLSRSPSKPIVKPAVATDIQEEPIESSKTPFLARSPSKISVSQHQHSQDDKTSKTPLLSRSPSKATKDANPFVTQASPTKTGETSLMDRLKLLRASPMKSILRSPQRLYSNDPSKIASGTHLATPEKAASSAKLLAIPPKTEPVRKHVDFTASTKGVKENDAVDSDPVTPSKETIPPLREIKTVEQAKLFYPPLPSEHTEKPASIKKFNRRMTLGADVANDFTFRVGGGITFAPSISAAKANLKPSIRHVSVEPEMISSTPTRKRKFSNDEDSTANSAQQTENPSSDKENDQHSEPDEAARPAKRARQSEAVSKPVQPMSNVSTQHQQKRLTLGVKPKNAPKTTAKPKDKRAGGFLSRDRLNMLAMPKRRAE